ncbi:MAG: GNAT family N-acetyltransferase [Hyphomicrobiaceae bacterium]
MDIVVRTLDAGDQTQWNRLFRAYVAFYEVDVADDVIALTFQRSIGASPDFLGFVAVDKAGLMRGFAMALLHRSTWSKTWYCYLEDLYVAPEARSLGVGRQLIEAVFAAADAAGASRTYWVTAENNATARRLYDHVAHLAPFVQYRR